MIGETSVTTTGISIECRPPPPPPDAALHKRFECDTHLDDTQPDDPTRAVILAVALDAPSIVMRTVTDSAPVVGMLVFATLETRLRSNEICKLKVPAPCVAPLPAMKPPPPPDTITFTSLDTLHALPFAITVVDDRHNDTVVSNPVPPIRCRSDEDQVLACFIKIVTDIAPEDGLLVIIIEDTSCCAYETNRVIVPSPLADNTTVVVAI